MALNPFQWGSNGRQIGPDEAKGMRAVAAALAAKTTAPKTLGEGLSRVGDALTEKYYNDTAAAGETEGAASRKAVMDALLANPDPSMTDIAGSMSNEWVASDPGSQAVVQALMGQEQQQQGWAHDATVRDDQRAYDAPLRDIQLQTGQMQLDTLKNPKPDPGFTLLTPEEAAAANLPEGAYQRGPDNKIYEIGGSGTNVNINTGDGAPGLGKLSTDYGYVLDPATGNPKIDPATGLPTAAAVPGSPAALEAAAAATKATAGNDSNSITTDTITNAAALARELAQKDGTTGLVGQFLSNASPTDAAELRRQVKVLTSTATIESLNAMRKESLTGGALGNVTEGEGQMLAAAAGAIDPNSSNADFMRQLSNYEQTLLRIVNGKDEGDALFNKRHPEMAGSGVPGQSQANPDVVDFTDYFKQ